MGWGKWRAGAQKLEKKLLWRAIYRNSPTLFRPVTFPSPIRPSPRLEVHNHHHKSNRKLRGNECTQRNNLYGRPIGFLGGIRSVLWAQPGTARIFFGYPYYHRSGYTDFTFCTHIHRVDRNKPMKNFGINSRGRTDVVMESRKFSRHPYIQGALRGHLCDSIASLVFNAFIYFELLKKRIGVRASIGFNKSTNKRLLNKLKTI